ncbi:MAG: DUF4065 domain-containing protein [Rickettsiales bacterium]
MSIGGVEEYRNNVSSIELKPAICSIGEIVNWFIEKSIKHKKTLTHLRLQRLLYLAYYNFLRKQSTILFDELPEAWEYSPIFPSVYYEYRKFGNTPLPYNKYIFFEDSTYDEKKERFVFFSKFIKDRNVDRFLSKEVWDKYVDYSDRELFDEIHNENYSKPWTKGRQSAENSNLRHVDIKNDDILAA